MEKRTKWYHRAAAAGLAVTMALSLAACGGKGNDPAAGGDVSGMSVEEIVKKSQENLAAASSLSYDMAMDMEMSAQGQTIAMTMNGVADHIVDPMQMKMDMSIDMGELGSAKTEMYMMDEDGQYVLYTGVDDGTGTLTWQKQTVADASAMEQYDAKASFDLYVSSAEDFQENGTETVGTVEATRYDGVIGKDAMSEVLQASGALSQMSALGMSATDVDALADSLGDLPLSLWISTADTMPVKYELDMTEMMRALMQGMGSETAQVEIGKMQMSMTVRNINGVESIEVPAEALAA